MFLVLHLTLSLTLPGGDFYSKVGDLKEPDWSEPLPAPEANLYSKVDGLKIPEWAQVSEGCGAVTADNDDLYSKLDDLKDPY